MKKETLLCDYNIPMNINLIEIGDIYTNWHKDLKIIYVIRGNLFIDIKSEQFLLEENQFIFVNSYDLSSVSPQVNENSLFLEILIDSNIINRMYPDFSYIKFKCYSNNPNFPVLKYDIIREHLSKILNIISINSAEKMMMIFNVLMELLIFIINNFKSSESFLKKDISNKNRLIKIFDFLEKNYDDENLNVELIAKYMGLSSQHLLKIFRENLGVTLAEYLNSLRIKKSLNDLLYSNKSIIEISIENGFNSSKSYHRLFKKIYRTTPGSYKKNFKETSFNLENNNISLEKEAILKKSIKYEPTKDKIRESSNEIELNLIELNFNKVKKTKIKHYWKKTTSLGKAFEGLRGDIQNQIKEIKKEINPDFIRFTGIFNDEMHIYNEDSVGNAYYNYSYIDKLIDFLIRLNLKPYINIGFMPKKLAGKEEYILMSSINVSYPKNINKWKELVAALMRHFIEKYGEKEVSSWYFEIWNNPNLNSMYWYDSDMRFYSFFSDTFNAIKSVSPKLKVGSPSANFQINIQWVNRFIDFLKEKNIKLDFFSFPSYDITENTEPIIVTQLPTWEETSISFNDICEKIKENYNKKIEIIISEWNLTTGSYNLSNDNCSKALYMIDTALSNINTANQLVYWTATENKVGDNIFYGGLGLFTTNNLKKASYNAFLLLNKLGDTLVSKGENHFITSDGDSIQVMLYNCDRTNDKNIVEKIKEIHLDISNFENGKYKITRYYLNSSSGSIYEAWQELGAPDKITDEIYNFLKAKERMNMKIETVNINNVLNIRELLDINSIVFLDITKNY